MPLRPAALLPRPLAAHLGLLALLGSAGCSLIVDFDPHDRPCSPDGACLSGYTCVDSRCVADGSRDDGDACGADANCQRGSVCLRPDEICGRECVRAFPAVDPCAAGLACVAGSADDDVAAGACVAGTCATTCPPSPSGAAQQCIELQPQVGRCLIGCTVQCTVGGACTGNCPLSESGGTLACQPLGASHALGCLAAGTLGHGASCDDIGERCAPGFACVQVASGASFCLAYCNPDAADPCGALRDPTSGALASCYAYGATHVCAGTSPG